MNFQEWNYGRKKKRMARRIHKEIFVEFGCSKYSIPPTDHISSIIDLQHDMKTDEWIAKLDYLRWVL